jgi:hypothetical protein
MTLSRDALRQRACACSFSPGCDYFVGLQAIQ